MVESYYERLVRNANIVEIEANNRSDVYDSSQRSVAYVVANGDVGDDTLNGFGVDDAIITGKKIYDRNGDGLIGFGKEGLLDIDRTSPRNAGNDQLSINWAGHSVTELRYLGEVEDRHVYAKSSTLSAFKLLFPDGVEGTVNFDNIDLGGKALLVDNRLGLDLGVDILFGVTTGTKIVTTAKLLDGDHDGKPDVFVGNSSSQRLEIIADSPTIKSLGALMFRGFETAQHSFVLVDQHTMGESVFYVYEFI